MNYFLIFSFQTDTTTYFPRVIIVYTAIVSSHQRPARISVLSRGNNFIGIQSIYTSNNVFIYNLSQSFLYAAQHSLCRIVALISRSYFHV